MSRVGKIPIVIPKNVKAQVNNGIVAIEGPKGKLSLTVPHGIKVELKDSQLIVDRLADAKQYRANQGTIRALLQNMMVGVTEGHKKELEIKGIGYRVQLQGTKLVFNLGLSHPVELQIPKEVKATVPNQTAITIEGPDNALVGQIAAKIRALKPVEPYKGKGIRYVGEFVRRKQGKSVTK